MNKLQQNFNPYSKQSSEELFNINMHQSLINRVYESSIEKSDKDSFIDIINRIISIFR